MLQALPPLMEAHNHAMKLSDRRALEINSQHPQRDGRGKMGRTRRTLGETKFESDEEHDDNLEGKGHSAPGTRLSRLVGSGRAKANKKALTQKIGQKSEELHKLEHEAIENDHYKQGGALASHLVQKYGKEHADMFGKGYMKGCGMSGGNIDIMTGNNDVGRVANPPASFERNTVGMGLSGGVSTHQPMTVSPNRHHLGGMGGGYTGGDGMSGGKKTRAKASPSDARRKRGQEVSRLMKQEGMTLGEASKHIKEHGY